MGRLSRRGGFGLLLALLLVGSAAEAGNSWDGTWAGGWENGDGIQIIIAGDKVIGVGRGMDYPEVLSSSVSPEGRMLSFSWIGGDGFLQRAGDREATISLREQGRPVRAFTVKRD